LVRSYRNEEGKPTQEVLVHLGEHTTPEAALAAWPGEIATHRRAGRDEQAKKLELKLVRLQELLDRRDVRGQSLEHIDTTIDTTSERI
jgi:hypothetical protein